MGSVPQRSAPQAPALRRAGSWVSGGRSGPPQQDEEPSLAAAVADYRKERDLVARMNPGNNMHIEGDLEEAGSDPLAGSPLARRLDAGGRLRHVVSSEDTEEQRGTL